MSVCVLYRNPNHWTDWDEIWHGGGPQGWKVLGGGVDLVPPPPWYGVHKWGPGCLWSLSHFGKNFIEQKLQGTPKM